jgi:hypothetical protein
LLLAGTVAAEGPDRRCRFPALEYVDTTRGDEVRAQREVQAAGRAARLLDDLNAAVQVRLTLCGLYKNLACDDDHAPLLAVVVDG